MKIKNNFSPVSHHENTVKVNSEGKIMKLYDINEKTGLPRIVSKFTKFNSEGVPMYPLVNELSGKKVFYSIDHIVCSAFKGYDLKENLIITHKDGDPTNCNIENLKARIYNKLEKELNLSLLDEPGEIWKEIPKLITGELIREYYCSNHGRFKSKAFTSIDGKKHKEKIIAQNLIGNYLYVGINGKSFIAHRLIYQVFKGEIKFNNDIDHLDRNSLNNNIDNLEQCSHKENMNNPKTLSFKKKQIIILSPNDEIIDVFGSLTEASKFYGTEIKIGGFLKNNIILSIESVRDRISRYLESENPVFNEIGDKLREQLELI